MDRHVTGRPTGSGRTDRGTIDHVAVDDADDRDPPETSPTKGTSAAAGRSVTEGPTRRSVLAGAGVVALGGLAGCLGDVTEHESSPYGVDESTASDADYDLSEVDTVVIEESVGIGPLTETVVATNYVVEYEKALDMGPLGEQRGGVFVTLSTPQVSAFGREFNPVADMDTRELIDLVQDSYDGMQNVERDADDEIDVLGETVEMTRFEAEATFDGSSVDVDVHVTEAAATGEDLVVTVGVYPRMLRDVEENHIRSMIGGVTSDADLDGGGDGTDGEDEDDEDGTGDDGGTDDEDDGEDGDEEDEDDGEDGDEEDEDDDGDDDEDDGLLP